MVNLTICQPLLIETHQQMLISALNIPLSVTAFLGNLLIIVALRKPLSLHPPSKLLFGCLASTDLCVGLIIQPLFAINVMSSKHYKRCYYAQLLLHGIGAIFCGESLLAMTAISVDRLLALMLGLQYRQVVTLKRVWVLVTALWLYNALISAILFYYAEIFLTLICIELLLCIIISSSCYSKIFLILRKHQAQVREHMHVHHEQLKGEIAVNIARRRRRCQVHYGCNPLVCFLMFHSA